MLEKSFSPEVQRPNKGVTKGEIKRSNGRKF